MIDSGKFDVNDKDRGGATALHRTAASLLSHSDEVSLLIKSGADITMKNNKGDTALDLVLKEPSNREVVQVLEDASANDEK
jgi:ankyrin repeat protein